MTPFEEKLHRLKELTGLTEDQAVGELLGLSKAALSDRKKRDRFPEDKLLALTARRPELGIDTGYVLLGVRTKELLDGFGERLRAARGGRSVASFAEKLGVAPDELAKVEQGQRRPSVDFMKSVATRAPDDVDLGLLLAGRPTALQSPLTQRETILVLNYRACSPADQETVARLVAFFASSKAHAASAASAAAGRASGEAAGGPESADG